MAIAPRYLYHSLRGNVGEALIDQLHLSNAFFPDVHLGFDLNTPSLLGFSGSPSVLLVVDDADASCYYHISRIQLWGLSSKCHAFRKGSH
jgi:hypothetical protein